MAPAQQKSEKTWLEKLEEFLVDEFHYEVHRVFLETAWVHEVMVGRWTGPIEFLQCLREQHANILKDHAKPAHVRSHLQGLNFSGKDVSGGIAPKYWADQLPCNRQKILLLHSIRLILENKDSSRVDLNLIVPIIRRELHQCIRGVFFHLKSRAHAQVLNDFVDEISQYEWLTIADVRERLQKHFLRWLDQQGVESREVNDLSKLRRFSNTLNAYVHYRPGQTEPVEFKYGHLFSDWTKLGFFNTVIYEIDLLGSLVRLETLSHSSGSTSEGENPDQLEASATRRAKGGTHYQNIIAIHYLLGSLKVNCHNTKKARFASFLTRFSENTFRQQWSNIHSKKDLNGVDWESDMKIVRSQFEELGLKETVRLIDLDLDSQTE